MKRSCPTCGKAVEAERLSECETYPFCSERCRLADLDRWFTEEYRIPARPDEKGAGDEPR